MSILRNAVVRRVKDGSFFPFCVVVYIYVVIEFVEYILYCGPGSSMIMGNHSLDVFIDKTFRLRFLDDSGVLVEQCASSILKSAALSITRKSLTWAASN